MFVHTMNDSSRDYYEILGVDPDATADQIKKAYRKLALKWHPDKNPDNAEEATSRFQLIGRAWEILSDPQERAWYDDHREAIINGTDGESMGSDDFCEFIMRYFSPTAFNGFGNDRFGFYSIYSGAFHEILQKEQKTDKTVNYPAFGTYDSSYEDVLHFYSQWLSFSTRRSFAAADQYNTREAVNRYVRRAMEKENNRKRDDARKQYNQTVLRLVEMCKKFDPRYSDAVKKRQEEEIRREEEKKKRQEEERKRREEELKEKMQTGVTETEEAERAFKLDDTVYEETGTNNLYECIACHKVFKSETQMRNHEQSKKHIAAVEELRKQLELEEELFVNKEKEVIQEEEAEVVESKKKEKKKKQKQIIVEEEKEEEGEEMSVLEMIEQMNSQNMKGRKAKNFSMTDDMESKKKEKKKKRKPVQPQNTENEKTKKASKTHKK